MSTTKKLRLGPLPKTESTKSHILVPGQSEIRSRPLTPRCTLRRMARRSYAMTLIPHMLEAFMAGG